jgi:hypothetical protein
LIAAAKLPPAYWDKTRQVPVAMDKDTKLPNYEGLILFITPDGGKSYVMRTWLVEGVRHFDAVTEGCFVTDETIKALEKTA